MTDASVRVPEITNPGREIDCDVIVRNGVPYYRQRVSIGGITEQTSGGTTQLVVVSEDVVPLLEKIVKELRLTNLHLATVTGEKFSLMDIGD